MKLNEIRAKAEAMQIKAGKMKKADLIRTIQLAEGNTPCFQEKAYCDQTACCWQDGCTAEMAA
jgi:hypothetical protein